MVWKISTSSMNWHPTVDQRSYVIYKVFQDSQSKPHGYAPAARGGHDMRACAHGGVRLFLGVIHSSAFRGEAGNLLIEVRTKDCIRENYLKLGNEVKKGDCLTF